MTIKRPKTYSPKMAAVIREWHLVDMSGKILGRTATLVSRLLLGKDKPTYAPHVDIGDFVVVINADKVAVSGEKMSKKLYHWHTGYPGGLRERSLGQMLQKDPQRVVEHAVSKMLPKNKLRSLRLRRLKVFTGTQHPYQDKFAQEKS